MQPFKLIEVFFICLGNESIYIELKCMDSSSLPSPMQLLSKSASPGITGQLEHEIEHLSKQFGIPSAEAIKNSLIYNSGT